MIDIGVDFLSNPSTAEGTGTCIVMVTPDAQRTMLTTLGCAPFLQQHHIQESFIAKAKILYIEGYLWDHPETITLVKKAIKIAKENQVKVAFSASDSFCVNRHKEDFLHLLNKEVDIFFANADEAMAITDTDTPEKAIDFAKSACNFMAITKDKKGSVIIANKETYEIASVPCRELDTTGAGDAYAAGILHGITHEMEIEAMGELASKISSEVVAKMGARY